MPCVPNLSARLRRVGPSCHSSVYRALSKVLHSDIGGDDRIQQDLNDAYAELSTNRKESA